VPAKVLGHGAELDHKTIKKCLWLDLASFFPPYPSKCLFVIAHDDPGVRAADERATVSKLKKRISHPLRLHD
jgi:hypothetical protein